MANERNTENLVRNDLRKKGYYEDENVIVEEQKSSSPKINKLLSKASKSGNGQGYPEFIITFKDRPEDLIVIECKASTTKHESKERNNAKDFAVDGVLLYAEYLKKEYNVTAIAVSGETDREKKISTFLWLKGAYRYTNIQDKLILSASEINDIINQQNTPLSENELVGKAIQLNKDLHEYSVPEMERCTLISAILVALQNEVFVKSYNLYSDNKELIDALYTACDSVLKNNGPDEEKRKIILAEYRKFENTDQFVSPFAKKRKEKKEVNNTILRDLITDLNTHILPYIKNNHFDILGKFYTQFIRYAASDKKTGLVLTPSHITDFFCDIVNLDKDDIVFDPCCGTGGFLVSAMNYMLNKGGNSQEKQKEIKSKQLIGIEKRTDMFSHTCSNMMMRGDGKSHIYKGDCFDKKLKEEIKSHNPNVSFLNPPYQDGNADEQLEFVENSIECITKNGLCVSICQMSTVVGSGNSLNAVKERLLKKHTLEAVFSMPDEIFSPAATVVTCILVFKAHVPHSSNKKTFFGYYKDDGFVKKKNKGRVDENNLWNKTKEKWVNAYLNKEQIQGLTVLQSVSHLDEWCAEAYMETDYSNISNNDFIKTIRNYVAYQFLNGDSNEIS